jgi:hypothetical protein
MKKWLVGTLIAVAALAIVAGGAVTAAFLSRNDVQTAMPGAWYEFRMGMGRQLSPTAAPMHEAFFATLAEGLGVSEDELEDRLRSGENLAEIAEAEGLGEDELDALIEEGNQEALQAAVEQGFLTQEQADWMAEHMPLARGMRGWPMMGGLRSPVRRGWTGDWMSPGRHPMWP